MVCRACDSNVGENEKYCPACGAELRPADEVFSITNVSCPQCQAQVNSECVRCPKCQADLQSVKQKEGETRYSKHQEVDAEGKFSDDQESSLGRLRKIVLGKNFCDLRRITLFGLVTKIAVLLCFGYLLVFAVNISYMYEDPYDRWLPFSWSFILNMSILPFFIFFAISTIKQLKRYHLYRHLLFCAEKGNDTDFANKLDDILKLQKWCKRFNIARFVLLLCCYFYIPLLYIGLLLTVTWMSEKYQFFDRCLSHIKSTNSYIVDETHIPNRKVITAVKIVTFSVIALISGLITFAPLEFEVVEAVLLILCSVTQIFEAVIQNDCEKEFEENLIILGKAPRK